MFVLGISSWYLLKARDVAFALRSFAIASSFGLASTLSVIVLGDESGYTAGEVNKVKLAAIEAEWETEAAPAAITVVGLPDDEQQRTHYAVKIPYVLGLIATRSADKAVTGIKELKQQHEVRIRNGMKAYAALARLKGGDKSPEAVLDFHRLKDDLGYGLLLKKYTPNVTDATEAQIKMAVNDTVPNVAPIFWSFRVMVGLGLLFLFIFTCAFYFLIRQRLAPQRWPPAVDHRRHPAHASVGVLAARLQPVLQPGRLHRLLHAAAGDRDDPDGEIRAPGAEQPAHRPVPLGAATANHRPTLRKRHAIRL
jgi:cytochrome d ubiquinol oxidase subunit I